MGKALELEIKNEVLEIENFLSISRASVKFSDVSTLIGPQASGKSVVVKALYFFRDYVGDMFLSFASSTDDRRKYNSEKQIEFYDLFKGSDDEGYNFRLVYKFSDHQIEVEKVKRSRRLKITVSPVLAKLVDRVRADYRKHLQSSAEKGNSFYPSFYRYMSSSEDIAKFYRSVPRTLFIPASRAFFSTIQANIFTFLSDSSSLDPLLVQFGRFLEAAKVDYNGGFRISGDKSKTERNYSLEAVICGQYIRDGDEDIIKTKWGKVPLQRSSSGQQEALPLLLAVSYYGKMKGHDNTTLIIEEPEAHLFPKAQKQVLEAIVGIVRRSGVKVVFTTHSPYILACLNNEIHRPIDKDAQTISIGVSAYLVNEGDISDIFDKEDLLVDTSRIDEVSEIIAREFVEHLDAKM